ncbi:hypothetical protein BDV38DRAFT_188844 [Aspergillus pseudotamarii]|uniref:Uncharacterized protein n=1 Tax=Aspergillus pseudotamarii TaxID=132259 RepID=A0A5N6T5C6_ASPPS|nr:uncharacterized protein BDV38DRAFT_188844 [Aspergillus pseudotamarii]KAE8141490.1 hypothetical protein BDV38DRAFT_188844 [Aspergillus pseudotamarii]
MRSLWIFNRPLEISVLVPSIFSTLTLHEDVILLKDSQTLHDRLGEKFNKPLLHRALLSGNSLCDRRLSSDVVCFHNLFILIRRGRGPCRPNTLTERPFYSLHPWSSLAMNVSITIGYMPAELTRLFMFHSAVIHLGGRPNQKDIDSQVTGIRRSTFYFLFFSAIQLNKVSITEGAPRFIANTATHQT